MPGIYSEWKQFIGAYLDGAYPEFVLKAQLGNDIPVFVNHHVLPDEFELCLSHLQRNGYSTLDADEHANGLLDKSNVPLKSVVMTFDDGTVDLYDIVYPLLRKYQMKIIVFLIPGWIGSRGMLNWDQITEMHRSGSVDFQSHSMNHPAIFTSPRIVDFYRPFGPNFKMWNVPLKRASAEECKMVAPEFGNPVYEYHSRFSNRKRYLPDSELDASCAAYVRVNGGAKFFKHRKWSRVLDDFVRTYRKQNDIRDGYESDSDQITSILEELYLSKYKIERELNNKTVRHFAFPWNQMGGVAIDMLMKSGYTTAYTGLIPDEVDSESSDQLKIVRRVTGDFIECLPGEGRRSFRSIMLRKMRRRLRRGLMY
ncbi:MAG: polysaccharide deacetylase family protein [candidate division KSB1 bacterium]|nr:polysaccharide deacetylase family protein [candidate division KSB1 bacterium]